MGVAVYRVWPHGHWTGVYRALSKARSDFTVSKIVPAISFTQPFPTVCVVRYGSLSAQRFEFAASY
jgi:hypothetical protein